MYESFFGLRERPFDLTPNPKYLYLTGRHREALSNLQYGIVGRKGITVLFGEAGTGKTTLIRAATHFLAPMNVRWVYISNPALTRSEFYQTLALKFRFSERARDSKAVFLVEAEEMLTAQHEAGGTTALIVDEAQSMPDELMEEVRLLANLETTDQKLLQVVLAGQPELAYRLEQEHLRQLKQRVALRCDLGPLDFAETAAYIAGRIKIAGGQASAIFTREAIGTIFERSRGIPRTVSVICDNAMVSAFASGQVPIGSHVVLDVCRDFKLNVAGRSPEPARPASLVLPGMALETTGGQQAAAPVFARAPGMVAGQQAAAPIIRRSPASLAGAPGMAASHQAATPIVPRAPGGVETQERRAPVFPPAAVSHEAALPGNGRAPDAVVSHEVELPGNGQGPHRVASHGATLPGNGQARFPETPRWLPVATESQKPEPPAEPPPAAVAEGKRERTGLFGMFTRTIKRFRFS